MLMEKNVELWESSLSYKWLAIYIARVLYGIAVIGFLSSLQVMWSGKITSLGDIASHSGPKYSSVVEIAHNLSRQNLNWRSFDLII